MLWFGLRIVVVATSVRRSAFKLCGGGVSSSSRCSSPGPRASPRAGPRARLRCSQPGRSNTINGTSGGCCVDACQGLLAFPHPLPKVKQLVPKTAAPKQ